MSDCESEDLYEVAGLVGKRLFFFREGRIEISGVVTGSVGTVPCLVCDVQFIGGA